jgi:ribokinase
VREDGRVRTAVVGHVEWVQFARVERVPGAGEIVHALEWWEEPGGGGAAAAVQLAKLSGNTLFFTALGNDHLGAMAIEALEARGPQLQVAFRDEPTRRAFTHVDGDGERTITVLGNRLGPSGDDPLAWAELDGVEAAYFTAGDATALAHARRSRVLVATSRVLTVLADAGVTVDALVGSASDPAERYEAGKLDPPPRLVVATEGALGGRYWVDGGPERRFGPPPLPGAIADRYGAGDSFAGGLTFALGKGASSADAIDFAARCGAAALTGRGPLEGQISDPALR